MIFCIALAACIFLVWRLYQRVRGIVGYHQLALFLAIRSLAVTILLLFVFRPEISYLKTAAEKPVLPVLIDVSRSMGVKDHPDMPNRLQQVQAILSHPPAELKDLFRYFEVRYYAFDESARDIGTREIPALKPEGESTFILNSIKDAVSNLQASRVHGILLFSDGADNSAAEPEDVLKDTGFPLFTVGVGAEMASARKMRDVRLVDVEAPRVVTANQLAQVNAFVDASGFRDHVAKVRLLREGKELAQATLVLDDLPGPQKVTLNYYAPPEVGRFEYMVEVPVEPSEQLEENNRRPFHWEVRDEPIRILYVEGKPRMEFKYLKRVLEQHESTEVIALLKVGPGRFIQQGKMHGVASLAGFPIDREGLEPFHVFIFGSISRSNFSALQLENLKDAVADGAGFAMLGGTGSFAAGGYAGTPIEEMLPARLLQSESTAERRPFSPRLTMEGERHPIFSGIARFFATGKSTPAVPLPQLLGFTPLGRPRSGAKVLLSHPGLPSPDRPYPILCVQQFGMGRTMALAASSTWQWYTLPVATGQRSPYVRFWVQACRWLAGRKDDAESSEQGVKAFLGEEYIEAGRAAVIHARAYDHQGLLSAGATISAVAKLKNGQSFNLSIPHVPGTRGMYEATFHPPSPGQYDITVTAELDGIQLGKPVRLKLRVQQARQELENLGLNEGLLRRIAQVSDGRYLAITQATSLAGLLWGEERERLTYRHVLLWNSPFLFLLFVILQTTEWALRKRKHLA